MKYTYYYRLHMELDNIFGMLMAYNLFSTATTLCCVAFYSILQGLNREGFGFLLFFFSCSAQFYMVCYYGQLLIDLVGGLLNCLWNIYSSTYYLESKHCPGCLHTHLVWRLAYLSKVSVTHYATSSKTSDAFS